MVSRHLGTTDDAETLQDRFLEAPLHPLEARVPPPVGAVTKATSAPSILIWRRSNRWQTLAPALKVRVQRAFAKLVKVEEGLKRIAGVG